MNKLIAIILLLITNATYADTLPTKEAAKELSEKVVSIIASGDFESGMRLMKPYTVIPESEFETSIQNAKYQWPAITQRFGKPVGTEFICENNISESYYYVLQTVKYERHAARFSFIFYKPKNAWILNTYYYDDQIQSLSCQ